MPALPLPTTAETRTTIRVAIVDDNVAFRESLENLLADDGFEVVGCASTGADALRLVDEVHPDVVLMDVRMPDGDGLTALGRIKLEKPELPVVMFSGFDNPTYIARAVALGANGYLFKTCKAKDLVAAIKTAAKGENTWTRTELRRVTGALATPRPGVDLEVPLTQREIQIVQQVVAGMSNKQIGDELGISYETVKEHVQHVLRKIGVTDRTQAAVWAVRTGLV